MTSPKFFSSIGAARKTHFPERTPSSEAAQTMLLCLSSNASGMDFDSNVQRAPLHNAYSQLVFRPAEVDLNGYSCALS